MPPSEPEPVLLAGNEHYGVLAVVRALRAAGYAPWLAVDKPGTYAGRSRATAGTVWMPDPDFDGEAFVRELATAAVRLSVAAVLPSTDSHFLTLAGRETDFPGSSLGVPSRESVDRATDKALLPELAAAAGLHTPPTTKVIGGDNEVVGTYGFPAVVKPLRSRARNPDGTITNRSARCVSAGQAK